MDLLVDQDAVVKDWEDGVALKVAQDSLWVNIIDLGQPWIERVLYLPQLLKVNLAERAIEHAWDGELGCSVVEPALIFLKEQVLVLIRKDLDSFTEVYTILRLVVRYRHYESSIDVCIRLHKLIDALDRVNLLRERYQGVQIIDHAIGADCDLE